MPGSRATTETLRLGLRVGTAVLERCPEAVVRQSSLRHGVSPTTWPAPPVTLARAQGLSRPRRRTRFPAQPARRTGHRVRMGGNARLGSTPAMLGPFRDPHFGEQ